MRYRQSSARMVLRQHNPRYIKPFIKTYKRERFRNTFFDPHNIQKHPCLGLPCTWEDVAEDIGSFASPDMLKTFTNLKYLKVKAGALDSIKKSVAVIVSRTIVILNLMMVMMVMVVMMMMMMIVGRMMMVMTTN